MIQKQRQAKQRPDKLTSANVVNNGANENLFVVYVKIKYEETLTLLSCVKVINALFKILALSVCALKIIHEFKTKGI